MISIETRTHLSFRSLRQMSVRAELAALKRDAQDVVRAWRRHPGRILGLWAVACIRVFRWHTDNNRFRKFAFLLMTLLVGTLLVGQSGFGWALAQIILVPVVAVWLIAFGVILGFEVERIKVAGWELDIGYATDDGDE